MGGILIIGATLVPTLLWGNSGNIYVWLAMGTMLTFGLVGWLDDYLKVRRNSPWASSPARSSSSRSAGGGDRAHLHLMARADGVRPAVCASLPQALAPLPGLALLALDRLHPGRLLQRRQPGRRAGRPGHRPDPDQRHGPDRPDLYRRARRLVPVPLYRPGAAGRRADRLRRGADRGLPRLPVVQLPSGPGLHGRCGGAFPRRDAGPDRPSHQAGAPALRRGRRIHHRGVVRHPPGRVFQDERRASASSRWPRSITISSSWAGPRRKWSSGSGSWASFSPCSAWPP